MHLKRKNYSAKYRTKAKAGQKRQKSKKNEKSVNLSQNLHTGHRPSVIAIP
jgi:hypothetical protein